MDIQDCSIEILDDVNKKGHCQIQLELSDRMTYIHRACQLQPLCVERIGNPWKQTRLFKSGESSNKDYTRYRATGS
jgi:hypothetical protein